MRPGAFSPKPAREVQPHLCRQPGLVQAHWRVPAPARHALLLGAHHGLIYLRCCGALMPVMFAVRAGSLGWMLALAVVTAIEKNTSRGRMLARPFGAALPGRSGQMVAAHA